MFLGLQRKPYANSSRFFWGRSTSGMINCTQTLKWNEKTPASEPELQQMCPECSRASVDRAAHGRLLGVDLTACITQVFILANVSFRGWSLLDHTQSRMDLRTAFLPSKVRNVVCWHPWLGFVYLQEYVSRKWPEGFQVCKYLMSKRMN